MRLPANRTKRLPSSETDFMKDGLEGTGFGPGPSRPSSWHKGDLFVLEGQRVRNKRQRQEREDEREGEGDREREEGYLSLPLGREETDVGHRQEGSL